MKHCRVFGLTAECALSLRYGLSRPGMLRLGRCEFAGKRTGAVGFKSHAISHSQAKWKTAPYRQPSIHPHAGGDEVPAPNRPEQLRAIMRLVTHSAVVCTSISGTAPRAMTMSSFNSLSLDPPVVTFHVATPSRTLDAVKECGQFNVHILAGDMGGAKVADWFTRGNLKDGLWETEGLESVGVRIEKGTGDGETPEPPVLQSKGVLYVLKCRLLDEEHGGVVMVRDHAIVLGEVEGILEGSARFHTEERFGLVYADRRYRQLGNTLVKIPAEGDGRKTG